MILSLLEMVQMSMWMLILASPKWVLNSHVKFKIFFSLLLLINMFWPYSNIIVFTNLEVCHCCSWASLYYSVREPVSFWDFKIMSHVISESKMNVLADSASTRSSYKWQLMLPRVVEISVLLPGFGCFLSCYCFLFQESCF